MLTSSQCRIVAYVGEGEIICRECAVAQTSSLTVDKLDQGYATGSELQPIIVAFSLVEFVSEQASQWADQEADYDIDPEVWQEAFDTAIEDYPCDSCGQPII